MENDQILIKKLDRFIKKFYRNKLIKGILFSIASLGSIYLVLIFNEYLFHFNKIVRATFLIAFISTTLFFLVRFIIIPVFQLLKYGKIISYEQAASIIGNHFVEIEDKLLNTIQLMRANKRSDEKSELLEASIDQKIERLKIIQFSSAINLRKNIKYLKYVGIPIILLLMLAVLSPKLISEPTKRIVRFNTNFIEPPKFWFEILNKELTVLQQDDYLLNIRINGEQLPNEVYLMSNGMSYKMIKEKANLHSYTFKSLQTDIIFQLKGGNILSEEFKIKVYPKPIILNFDLTVDYPKYVDKPTETYENIGDVSVPEGSDVRWIFYTKDVKEIHVNFLNESISLKKAEGNKFSFDRRFLSSDSYTIVPINNYSPNSDSLFYKISVIKDGYPSIVVNQESDSTLRSMVFFQGLIKDDYGFTKLLFSYETRHENDTAIIRRQQFNIPVMPTLNNQNFYYTMDLSTLNFVSKEQVSYYFEVWDNDGVNGHKSTRTEIKMISPPTLEEIEALTEKTEEKIEKSFKTGLKKSEELKKEVEDLSRKMVEKSTLTWQEKRKMEEILRSQESILKNIENIKKENLNNIENENKYLNTSERILEKQLELNRLMDQLLTDEMKKIMEEMKKLLNELDKNKLSELIEKMKLTNKDIEEQLDRNLELFKQIEFDRKIENLVNNLRENADEQEKLAEKSKTEKSADGLLEREQKKIKDKSDTIQSTLKKLDEESKNVKNKPDMEKALEMQDSIGKKLEQIERKMKEKISKDNGKEQREATEQMKELAMEIEQSMQEDEMEQAEEDAEMIRMILENLIRLSYEQEDLIKTTQVISKTDPKYNGVIDQQKGMNDKLRGSEDSLNEIAKRQIILQPIISREISALRGNIGLAIESMNNRNIKTAVAQQQLAMTAINNLALLLSESLEKMNQQMDMSMSGKGKKSACKKPGKSDGKGSMKNLNSLQQKLGEQLDQLKKGMEKAKKDGKGNKLSETSLNKQIAKLAAEQEAIRNEMQKYRDNLQENGVNESGSLKEAMKNMELNETDLINKRITQETIKRQQDITTRMLESEKAEQMREREEKRESNEAKNASYGNPFSDFKYKEKRRTDQELLQLIFPGLNPFYKSKVSDYMLKLNR